MNPPHAPRRPSHLDGRVLGRHPPCPAAPAWADITSEKLVTTVETITDNITITSNEYALIATNPGGHASMSGLAISVSPPAWGNIYGAWASNFGEISLTNVTVNTTGPGVGYDGLYASDNGNITMAGGSITTAGTNSYGAYALRGRITLLGNASVTTTGSGSHGLAADATNWSGTAVDVNGVTRTGTWDIVSRYEVRDNVQLALNRGLAGVMWWTLSYDATNKLSLQRVAPAGSGFLPQPAGELHDAARAGAVGEEPSPVPVQVHGEGDRLGREVQKARDLAAVEVGRDRLHRHDVAPSIDALRPDEGSLPIEGFAARRVHLVHERAGIAAV